MTLRSTEVEGLAIRHVVVSAALCVMRYNCISLKKVALTTPLLGGEMILRRLEMIEEAKTTIHGQG